MIKIILIHLKMQNIYKYIYNYIYKYNFFFSKFKLFLLRNILNISIHYIFQKNCKKLDEKIV